MTGSRRPPPQPPKKGTSSIDSTILAPRPSITGPSEEESGPVFTGDEATHTMKAPPKNAISISTSEVSLIEAQEIGPAPSDVGFDDNAPQTLGIEFEDNHPATEVLRLAFSDPGGESLTPTGDVQAEAPPIVRKWKAGAGGNPNQMSGAPAPRASAASDDGELEDPPAVELAMPSSIRGPIFQLPELDDPSVGSAGTRVDAQAGPDGIDRTGARVDARVDARGPARVEPLDLDELRRTLEEAEKLLRTAKTQASGLDLDLVAPGARGMNAQLAAALHRLGEALAMLRR